MNRIKKSIDEWFKQSKYDLKTAEAMFETKRYIYTVFMCHLSIEKALKGLYTKKFNEIPPKIHDLVSLSQKINLVLLPEAQSFIDELSAISIPSRYPDELKSLIKKYNKRKVNKILIKTKETLKWLEKKSKE